MNGIGHSDTEKEEEERLPNMTGITGHDVAIGSDMHASRKKLGDAMTTKLEGVSESYKQALNIFLRDFIVDNSYARKIINMLAVQIPHSADAILNFIREIYEATGIDLMREAFYQYWKSHGELPEFYRSEKNAKFDLRCLYPDDPRLHSKTDSTLGEYIDDWQGMNITDDQRFWCEVGEHVKTGLDPEVEERLANMFVERIESLGEKPDLITLVPAPDPKKTLEEHQMHPFASKISKKTGILFPSQPFIRSTKETIRMETYQGEKKYFDRRSLRDGVIEADKQKVEGKTILLLDDGWSSGATLDEVKKVLYENGAKKVMSMHLIRC